MLTEKIVRDVKTKTLRDTVRDIERWVGHLQKKDPVYTEVENLLLKHIPTVLLLPSSKWLETMRLLYAALRRSNHMVQSIDAALGYKRGPIYPAEDVEKLLGDLKKRGYLKKRGTSKKRGTRST